MDTKSINKLKLPKKDIDNIINNYIKEKVDTLVPIYYKTLVEELKIKKNNDRFLYFENKDVYYDFSTGCIFPNFFSKESFENNVFSNFQGRKMTDKERKIFRSVFPKKNSKKIYVDCEVEKSGDGKSWESAFKTITEAINVANTDDDIIVAEGEYQEVLTLKSNIKIYGGYNKNQNKLFIAPEKETIIKGNINIKNIENITLSYITITGNSGLYIENSKNFEGYNLEIKENHFNSYSGSPKAVYIYNSSGIFYDCLIKKNNVSYGRSYNIYGGATYIANSNIIFIKCGFYNNSNINSCSSGYECGGAIFSDGSNNNLKFIKCDFKNNKAYYGADIYRNSGNIYSDFEYTISYHGDISKISYDDLEDELKNKIESLEKYPIYNLIEDFENEEKVFNGLAYSNLLELSEIKIQNTFLRENFSLEKGFLLDEIYRKLLDNIFDLNLDGEILSKKSVTERVESGELKIPSETLSNIFLNSDKNKINITPYDKKILEDITRGHWDLWEDNYQGDIEIELDKEMIARNPKADINYNGVVAIDFGTKSTVVVYQKDDDTTYIKRIGAENLENSVDNKDYENPTVLEFRDLKKFIKDYQSRSGRPDTNWETLTSSYTAFTRIFEGGSDEFYSILADLKQWAGTNKKIKIKDKKGNSWDLPLFSDLDLDSDINPIEIYAYYIGLAINNMHGDGIFIDYILSFPVKYEKDLCEKICSSFERGLKKSLPCSLLKDEEVMKKFKVRIGANEPAAYAVCALQEYGFEPEDDEEIAYGVFDFGGGTTDFDFGIWREPQKGSYDFEIEHFYDNGDRYLGGENILQLLSFEIFKDESNQENLKKNGITFTLPPECVAYPGSDTLIINSQEAELNMKKMMEECRYFWEHNGESFVNPNGDSSKYETGILTIPLYDREGNIKSCELNINEEKLREVIISRIDKGVRNFFESWRIAVKNMNKPEKFYIFLGGNSSKSNFVEESFKKHIKLLSEELENSKIENMFEIFPPLGTEEAKAIQEERGGSIYEEIIEPTGKTGVAYGLIRSRESGKIKVIKGKSNNFKYFIGLEKRRKFKLIISRDVELNVWYEFMTADRKEFEIFYTDLPEANSGSLPIKNVKKLHCEIENIDENKNIYIRAVSNNEIEYIVSTKEELENSQEKIYKKELM